LILIPPKYAVSQVAGFMKERVPSTSPVCTAKGNEISLAKSFWARGFFASTVGRDEAVIREYIKNQEAEDNRLEQLRLWR
jgi:putative transposase